MGLPWLTLAHAGSIQFTPAFPGSKIISPSSFVRNVALTCLIWLMLTHSGSHAKKFQLMFACRNALALIVGVLCGSEELFCQGKMCSPFLCCHWQLSHFVLVELQHIFTVLCDCLQSFSMHCNCSQWSHISVLAITDDKFAPSPRNTD